MKGRREMKKQEEQVVIERQMELFRAAAEQHQCVWDPDRFVMLVDMMFAAARRTGQLDLIFDRKSN
jgi:hypothetical protein